LNKKNLDSCAVPQSNLQLHQKPRSDASLSDEWETPQGLFEYLCHEYDIDCQLDVCCDDFNIKGTYRLPNGNSLDYEWVNHFKSDVWCNPPHSQNEKFVRKAHEQWQKHNINIMMILPCNTQSSVYWHECIEGIVEYHPIKGRIKFLVNGEPSKHPSRNAYCVVIWRKK
jgi:phage N-6-adenine-methyltransferase